MHRAEVAAYIDHTLLKPEATDEQVASLLAEAAALGTYSVCVSPNKLPLDAPPGVKVATVCGFPSGAHQSTTKAVEAADSVARGADEIDMVIDVSAATTDDFAAVQADIQTVRDVCPAPVVLKVIIESAVLTDDQIVGCCRAAESAGADFVKTSTGFHPAGGATVHDVELMRRTVGNRLGVKASGGIRTADDALAMIRAGASRLGLSSSAAVLEHIPDTDADEAVFDAAERWLISDPDVRTQMELRQVITAASAGDADALVDLRSRFAGPLAFGTAGLRGAVGAGESRMNVAVVTRATAGLARYLIDTVGADATVIVGCDARHGSSEFTHAALEVLSGAGLRAMGLPQQLPTPVTAFAVRALGVDAGIQITASHNPPADNGYKVYLGGRATDRDGQGVQIVPPADADIAARIAAAPPADQVPRTTEHIQPVDPQVVVDYVRRMASHRDAAEPSTVRVVFTAMHGVGGATLQQVFDEAEIPDTHPVVEQLAPDPDFPTVSFPNPEEPGALDLSLALAVKVSADVVIALDPDADRCSVAIGQRDGTWRQLTGDEIGSLLGEQAAADRSREGDVLACSIVSSRQLSRIAAAHGLLSATTLTGFKWIARTPYLRFGYEEAIGYCADPPAVHDKDGIGAAIRIVTLIEMLAAQGKTIEDQLDHLARTYDLHTTSQLSFRVGDRSLIADAMARLRAAGPTCIAGSAVVEFRDLEQGSDDLPPTDGLLYRTAADDRVIIRPSGTEPKLKCYLEVVSPCDDDIPRTAAAERITTIEAELTELLGLPR